MALKIRNRSIPSDQSRDPGSVAAITYNEKSGAQKNTEVGRALLPLPLTATTWTTDASTKRSLPSAGRNLAIYNNSAAVHAVTVGDSTMAAQAAGVVQTSGSPSAPFVGVPVPPNEWLYLACGEWSFVQTDSALLLVFLIDDPSYIITQPANNAST